MERKTPAKKAVSPRCGSTAYDGCADLEPAAFRSSFSERLGRGGAHQRIAVKPTNLLRIGATALTLPCAQGLGFSIISHGASSTDR